MVMQNQNEESVQFELALSQKSKPTAIQIRNRRYKKLKELRDSGFFSEDAIKIRHPLLYHTYLGQHSQRSTPQSNVNCTLSQFLQKNLINLEYREKLSEELGKKMSTEDNKSEGWQLLEEFSGEVTVGKDGIRDTGIKKSWDLVQEQEIQLEEENLIDHAEQLFLDGKVDENYINYAEIDNCSDYDEQFQQGNNRQAQQRFFNQDGNHEEDQRINREYYTGIQDY